MNKTKAQKIGIVILAAGNSSRLGTPKQMVAFRGETLLRRIVRESSQSRAHSIIVVLGKDAEEFRRELREFDAQTIVNENWRQGMGGSVSVGIDKLMERRENFDAAVLTVCDQPFVTSAVIDQLIEVFETQNALIVASAYGKTLGVPALFAASLFAELAALQSAGGAKKLIEKYLRETVAVDFPHGEIDLDTPEDLQKLQNL